jgi:hypothetical protein
MTRFVQSSTKTVNRTKQNSVCPVVTGLVLVVAMIVCAEIRTPNFSVTVIGRQAPSAEQFRDRPSGARTLAHIVGQLRKTNESEC